MTRLETAKKKLERLEKEYSQAIDSEFEHTMSTHGSPVNDKKGASSFFNKQEKLHTKVILLAAELNKQRKRVAKLKNLEHNKNQGLTAAGGLKTSIHNIDALKKRIAEAEELIAKKEHTKYTRKKLRDDKQKLEDLLIMQHIIDNVEIDEYFKKLIENGTLKQYKAMPTIYFIKDLKKVAIELNVDSKFVPCWRYPAYEDEHRNLVNKIIHKKY